MADGIVVTYDVDYLPFGKNFSFGVWGGINAQGTYKEFNYVLKYNNGGFSAILADTYNFSDYATYNHDNFFDYNSSTTGRFLDLRLAYRFGEGFPLRVGWSTILFGRDRNSENTENRFSTYCSLEYPILNRGKWRIDAKLGGAFTLNSCGESANFYGSTAGIVNIAMVVTRDIEIKEYHLPVSMTAMFNPDSNQAYLQLAVRLFSF